MEPREVAELVMDRIWGYCSKNRDDVAVKCYADHHPDELGTFIYSFLPEKEAEELKKVMANSSTFLDEVKKEYEKLWNEEMSLRYGQLLSDEITGGYESIIQNDEISDETKAKRLKAYAKVLSEFANAINRALREKKPLTELELLDWFDKMGDAVFGLKNYSYYEMIGYYVGFYEGLNDTGKLDVLSILLDEIGNVLYDIDKDLSELGALANER
jgi:hypothetical protein